MLRPPQIPILASLFIHTLLALLFLKHPAQKQKAIQIELRERKLVLPKPRGDSRPDPRQSSHFNFNSFKPRGRPLGEALKESRDFTKGGETGLEQETWGSHGASLGEIAHLNQYLRLFNEVEGLLNYPSALGEHGISGTVNSRLRFDSNSHCDWSRTSVGGAHPYLRVYTLALLKKLCALENIEHLHFSAQQFVDLSFAFVLTQFPELSKDQIRHDSIQGNVLSFYRSHVHSDLEYRIGPLRGYLFAPVVSIDFPWIFENWEKYRS